MTNLAIVQDQPLKRSRAEIVGLIRASGQRTIAAIIETGQLLIAAKNELPHGEFIAMVRSDLPFLESTAERLMAIARHPVLSNSEYAPNLPPRWDTLYALTLIKPPEELSKGITDGWISPQMTRRDVTARRKVQPPATEQKKRRFPGLKPGCRITVPSNKAISDLCRIGMQLERDGVDQVDAAKQCGLGVRTFQLARCIVQLADRDDLSEHDKATANRALSAMNETQRIAEPYEIVRPLVDRVWGRGRGKAARSEKGAARRLENFKTAITIIADACSSGRHVEVPYLSEPDKDQTIRQIRESISALRSLMTIVGDQNGGQ